MLPTKIRLKSDITYNLKADSTVISKCIVKRVEHTPHIYSRIYETLNPHIKLNFVTSKKFAFSKQVLMLILLVNF